MNTNEFNHWVSKFQEALVVLGKRDPASAKDLRENVKINSMYRTIRYIGENTDLAGCFLPLSAVAKKKYQKWRRGD